jgi:hypothetical protein
LSYWWIVAQTARALVLFDQSLAEAHLTEVFLALATATGVPHEIRTDATLESIEVFVHLIGVGNALGCEKGSNFKVISTQFLV